MGHSVEERNPGGDFLTLQLSDRTVKSGEGWALLPGDKGQDTRKCP